MTDEEDVRTCRTELLLANSFFYIAMVTRLRNDSCETLCVHTRIFIVCVYVKTVKWASEQFQCWRQMSLAISVKSRVDIINVHELSRSDWPYLLEQSAMLHLLALIHNIHCKTFVNIKCDELRFKLPTSTGNWL